MKRKSKYLVVAVVLLTAMLVVALCACNDEEEGDATPQDTSYVIQYTDDTGTYTIDVKKGQPYSMNTLPVREGYDFIGLYDLEYGGTQYINAQGASLAPFSDGKNLVLFPQYKAKEYTLILDYQGAPVTGMREMAVSYNTRISDLPIGLTLENKEFVGWFTEPDRGGLQVADEYGVKPENSIISASRFDLSDKDGFIYLYAGFKGETHTVTFYISEDVAPEEVKIEHGTRIKDVDVEYRNTDGFAVYTWSKIENDTDRTAVFNGKVESDLTLYALDFAPVIDFDSNGGEEVSAIIAKAGSSIKLPSTERENWQFAGWYTSGGNSYSVMSMPSSSVKLTAKWTPMIVFDERGGVEVSDIAAERGEKVVLPATTKDGYVFAGWYTELGEEYTDTAMPKDSIKLVAKYRKTLTKKYVLIEASEVVGNRSTPELPTMTGSYATYHTIDLSELYNMGIEHIKLTIHYRVKAKTDIAAKNGVAQMSWYNTFSPSDAYRVWQYDDGFDQGGEVWKNVERAKEISLSTPNLYVCRHFSTSSDRWYNYYQWTDFWVQVEYPDMSKLY